MKKSLFLIGSLFIGMLNGFFGSGGGVLAVPLLQKSGVDVKTSHATSIAVTFFLSIISTVIYLTKGSIDMEKALPLIPFGIVGAVIGSILMKKISVKILKGIFGFLLIASAARLLWI